MPTKPKPPTPEEQAAFQLANQFRDHVVARVKVKGAALECPREKSDMTPCLARDGELAVAFDSFYGIGAPTVDKAICVGCGTRLKFLWDAEQTKT